MGDSSDIQRAAAILDAGGVVAMPTETVYGLAARIDRPAGVRAIFDRKQRPLFDPLIVHVASIAQAKRVTRTWPAAADRLGQRFWPGPLTLVLPKADTVDPLITAGLDTVGVRMPNHALALALIKGAGPVAAPSANRFGRTSPTTPAHVHDEFPGEHLLVLDGGACIVGVESTVVRLSEGATGTLVEILRPGQVTAHDLADALAGLPGAVEIVRAGAEASRASPGHMERHYQPAIPLALIDGDLPMGEAVRIARERLGIDDETGAAATLALDADPRIAARTLYADMRRLGASGAALLVVRLGGARSGEAWAAIRDRLERASSVVVGGA
ncbi:MAG: L-threonylcarbamoyladenylate synthase [Phycisphaerales bacterium]